MRKQYRQLPKATIEINHKFRFLPSILESIWKTFYSIKISIAMRKILQICHLPKSLINKLCPFSIQQAKQAIISGDTKFLLQIMQSSPGLDHQQSLLMFALTEAEERISLALIQSYHSQLDFHKRNEKGDTALMIAIFMEKKQAARALIRYSEINSCDFYRNTPFIAAAANGDIETLQNLIACSELVAQARNRVGHTALHRACYYGQNDTIEWLLQRTSLKIGQTDKKGNNCLHIACSSAQIVTTRFLIAKVRHPLRLLEENKDKMTPYMLMKDALSKIALNTDSNLHLEHLIPESYDQ